MNIAAVIREVAQDFDLDAFMRLHKLDPPIDWCDKEPRPGLEFVWQETPHQGPFDYSQLHRQIGDRDGWNCTYCATPLANPSDLSRWQWIPGEIHIGCCHCGEHEVEERIEPCIRDGGWVAASGFKLSYKDHVVPKSRGGSNDPSNLVIVCVHCNSSKGSRLLSELPEGWPFVNGPMFPPEHLDQEDEYLEDVCGTLDHTSCSCDDGWIWVDDGSVERCRSAQLFT